MSFMKPLVGPLAGAAASAIPVVGPIVGPMVGSAVGSLMTKSPNSSALGPLGQGMQAGYNLSGTMANLAGRSFNPVIDYWSRILSGNRASAMSALAPEIARMGDQNTAEMRAASTLMPRSGGRASLMSSLPFTNTQNIQSLFQGLRPQAATSLGGLGTNLMSQSLNALNAGTMAGRSIMDYQLQKQIADRLLGASMGGPLADAFKNVDFSSIFKRTPKDVPFSGPINQGGAIIAPTDIEAGSSQT